MASISDNAGTPSTRELVRQPARDQVWDLILGHAGSAAHVAALRVDARLLRTTVFHQQVDILHGCLIVELAIDTEDRCRRLVEQTEVQQREFRRCFRNSSMVLAPMAWLRASNKLCGPNK